MKNSIRLSLTVLGVASLVSFQNCAPIEFAATKTAIGKTTTPVVVIATPTPTPVPNGGSQCLQTDIIQDGSMAKPWRIDSCECLQAIETAPRDSNKSQYFLIANDFDCTSVSGQNAGLGFVSIKYFQGTLDGNNKTISNLASTRTNASVFYGDLSGQIKNLKFQNLRLVSLAVGSTASFHVANILAVQLPYRLMDIQNVTLENIYVEADQEASGFSNRPIGDIRNLKVTGIIKAKQKASGLVGELYSIRIDDSSSTQLSTLQNSEFNGELRSAWVLGGLVGVNLGLIKNSKSTLVVSEVYQPNQQFGFGGIAGGSCGGGSIENSQSYGTVNLSATITAPPMVVIPAPPHVAYLFIYGALVGFNGACSVNNPALPAFGTVTNSTSSIVGNIRIEKAIGVPTSTTFQIDVYAHDLIGVVGNSVGNSYSGQFSYQHIGF